MKPNELMIRDWVANPINGKPMRVMSLTRDVELGLSGFYDEVYPIPLTEEILAKNGFVKEHHCSWLMLYMWSTGGVAEFADVTIEVCQDHADKWRWDCLTLKIHLYKGDIKLNKIRYVHQLQHALRLCNIEKEIEL